MQARRIARELALLSLSQLPSDPHKIQAQQLQDVVLAAVRTLTTEAQDALETAAAELKRGNNRLLESETRSTTIDSARAMLAEAAEITQTAINLVGNALELPEFIQLANQREVRDYAMQILTNVAAHKADIDELLIQNLVDWQLNRLAKVDQDILRVAVAEIKYLGTPERVTINEAVEISKRYSGEEGHRFINGVLRRVSNYLKSETVAGNLASAESAAAETEPSVS